MTSLTTIARIGFNPPADYAYGIEIFRASEWLQRVPQDHFSYPSRLDFYQWILVTQGQFRHTVDFQLEPTPSGSLLAMRPGQVQNFETNKKWDGWIVIFRPESFQSTGAMGSQTLRLSVDDIPVRLCLEAASFHAAEAALAQMQLDASLAGQMHLVGALECTQLQAVLIRLLLASEQQQAAPIPDSLHARHFRKYRDATEQKHHEWHRVADYANALGISEKTLGRATLEVTGQSAKTYLSKRIALEAKRMLAYTNWPIANVADKLGFDEPTNFIKFFRREAQCAPSAFRKKHRGS